MAPTGYAGPVGLERYRDVSVQPCERWAARMASMRFAYLDWSLAPWPALNLGLMFTDAPHPQSHGTVGELRRLASFSHSLAMMCATAR